MKIFFTTFFILFSLISVKLTAQQAVVSGGDYHENENISISWTLGELSIETLRSDGLILTQGFQQSNLTIVSTEDFFPDLKISAYPNPTSDYLRVSFDNQMPLNTSINLYDMSGMLIYSIQPAGANNDISMRSYDTGLYLIRITSGEKLIKSFKILKQ